MAYFTIEGYNSYSGCDITVTASLPQINGEAVNKYYTLGSLQTLSISTHQDKRPVRSLGVINAKDYVMGPRTIAGSMVFAVFNRHFATEIMNDLGASTGRNVILPDEIPALNITVNFANEYGRMSRMAIYGVKIINEGQVMSINDLYTENTYQFVALGLEPLNVDIDTSGSGNNKSNPINKYDDETTTQKDLGPSPGNYGARKGRALYEPIGNESVALETTNSTDALLQDKNFMNNSGANISDQIQNNSKVNNNSILGLNISGKNNPITLSVVVEQPRSVNDTGFAIFTLKPKQTSGTIYIYPINSKNIIQEYSIIVDNKKSLIINLPAGDYQAQYANLSAETSNTVYFTVDKYVEVQTTSYTDSYPIVEQVTNNSILVSKSNRSHDTLVYFEEGRPLNSVSFKDQESNSSNKTARMLIDLTPDTEYKIYTTDSSSNSNDRSQIITVKTYANEKQELIMLNEFISYNKIFLLNLEKGNIDVEDYHKYNSIIDMVLDLPDSIQKQELLIYATELANQLNVSHNIDNINNKNYITNEVQEDPFSTIIQLIDYNSMYVYNDNNGKETLNTVLKKADNEVFYAKPNKHYDLYGLTDLGFKSVKKHITVCKNSSAEELERYRETNLYKDIDLTEYMNEYRLYTFDTVEALAIRDNFHSDINILKPPYIYQMDNEIYANINYLNLNRHCTYYLCCSEIHSALDYCPKRKIPFTSDMITDSLRLKDFYLGITKHKKYLFWIEDFNFIKISKPFLFADQETEEHKELNNVYKDELHSKVLSLKKEMIRVYDNKTVIDDAFDYIYELNPSQKDFDTTLISELINIMENSYYVSNVLEPLYELLKIMHDYNTVKDLPKIKINKKDRTITFEDLKDYYICAINFSDSTERLFEENNIVSYGHEGYTFIYLESHNMVYRTGFILIDNRRNVYKSTSDLDERIEEGDK